jgi:4a-hydroxytetrahydrobiopterin dehydratase
VAQAVGDAARDLDVAIAPDGVEFRLATHGAGRTVQGGHEALARTIDEVAAAHGLAAAPRPHALHPAADGGSAAFWAALLGGDDGGPPATPRPSPRADARRVPGEPTAATGARWHLDLWLAPDVAPARIAAALAAGGRVVDDAAAPTYTVLADPDGYLACVCTVEEVGGGAAG